MERSEEVKDYKDVESKLRGIAGKFGTSVDTPSPFKDTNFMTKDIICKRRLSNGLWYELSYGSNISHTGWMIGVTIASFKTGTHYDLSTCCHEFEEVEEALTKASNYN